MDIEVLRGHSGILIPPDRISLHGHLYVVNETPTVGGPCLFMLPFRFGGYRQDKKRYLQRDDKFQQL